ncbi:MAG: hypothetical protein ACXWIQ_09635 [Caldimonas sp.]
MQKTRSWLIAACASLLVACGGGGDSGAPSPAGSTPAETANVTVTVVDTLGRFVAGASVASGASNASSDAAGVATIAVATGGERVVAVTKAGFAEQFKVVNLPSGNTATVSLQAMLIARAAAQTIDTIEGGGSASGPQGVKVTFPANALVNAAGQPVSGAIQMSMTPVDVSEVDVGAFPGLFEGIPTGATRQAIVSVGTSELVPEQGGQKLQLAAGKTADIELPLFIARRQDGSTLAVGDSVPLWSLDTATGLWKQEGSGSVVASAASPTGLALRATISHFSWWNGDFAAQQATANLTVNVSGTTLPANTIASVSGTVIAGSGPSSTATGTVAVGSTGQFKVVAAGSTTRLSAQVLTPTQACGGSVDVSPAANSTVAATITMSCVTLDVRLVRPASDVSTNSQSALPFRIEVSGSSPDSVELFADTTRVAQFGAQFFYAGFWDTSTFAEGSYALHARATKAGVVRDSGSLTVIVDRTAPRATGFTPAVTVDVDRNTTFTVTFDETVLAAPFALSDAIRLTVTPVGATTPVAIPFTVSQDATATTLTVLPAATMPIGVASLSWGGLHDAAGNAVTGTVAASWNVARAAALGAAFDFKLFGTVAFATDPGGVVHVLRQREDNGNVQMLRFDGTSFVSFGPPANERAAGGEMALAIDRSGVIYAAVEQLDAAGSNAEIAVRRFDAVGNAWQTLAAPFPVGRSLGQSGHPRLAIDPANRPVLSFIGGAGNFELQAHRFAGTAWTPFGNAAGFVFSAQSLALNAAGNPVIAYKQGFAASNAEELRVAAFNGTAWTTLGALDSVPNATDSLGEPQIAIAPDDKPWVAWQRLSSASVKLARFDGAAFVAVPIAPDLTTFNGVVGLTFLNGDPVVAGGVSFGVEQIDLRRLHNGVWEPPAVFSTAKPLAMTLIADGTSILVGDSAFTFGVGRGTVTRVAFP